MAELPLISAVVPFADVGWPRRLMPAIFLSGCNLRCHYCINRELVLGDGDKREAEEVLRYFQFASEPWLLVTGGEPLLNPGILPLLRHMQETGFYVALATNGTQWERLQQALKERLVDFVSMDVKTSLEYDRYTELTGRLDPDEFDSILQTIDGIKDFNVGREFRTTVCSKYVDFEVLREIASWIGKREVLVLQVFEPRQTISPELASEKWVVPFETLKEWATRLEREYECVAIVREV